MHAIQCKRVQALRDQLASFPTAGAETVRLKTEWNWAGDSTRANQGFGAVVREQPPAFDPLLQLKDAADYFAVNGFVVLNSCLNDFELAELNTFFDKTQESLPHKWGIGANRKPHHRAQGFIYSQPLLDHPELDVYTRHASSFPLVEHLLGGEGSARFAEFNFRETPRGAGAGAMNFHQDANREDRLTRKPYMPCDWLCAIHYLTDVSADTPTFCVVPRSNKYRTLKEAFGSLGSDYMEVPLYGAAGTCILYDTALFHTRLDGELAENEALRRRTWHQYYARGGWRKTDTKYTRAPSNVLTDWNLVPKRLALSGDQDERVFFSHWNTAMGEWAASDFDKEVRRAMPRGEQ
jgi:hypothetical protein